MTKKNAFVKPVAKTYSADIALIAFILRFIFIFEEKKTLFEWDETGVSQTVLWSNHTDIAFIDMPLRFTFF